MGSLHVLLQISPLIRLVVANMAFKIKRIRVRPQVLGQIILDGESFVAQRAEMLLLFGMHRHVNVQVALEAKFPAANITTEQSFIFVAFLVHVQRRIGFERLRAGRAFEQFILHVNTSQVIQNDAFAAEVLFANVTFEFLDFLVEMLQVVSQAGSIGEFLIAQ